MFSTTTLWVIIAVLAVVIGLLFAFIYKAFSALGEAAETVAKAFWR